MDAIKKKMTQPGGAVFLAILSAAIWIILDLSALWLISFVINKRIDQATSKSKNMKINLKKESIQIQPAFNSSEINRYPLVDFYISGSYNSCCAGELQDDWISLEPL